MNPLTSVLRILAIAGAAWGIIGNAFFGGEQPERAEYSYYVLFASAAAVVGLLFVWRRSASLLANNADVLVPFGLFLLFQAVTPAVFSTPFLTISGGALSFSLLSVLTPMKLIGSFVRVLMMGWTVRMILRLTETGRAELVDSFRDFWWWFPRTVFVNYLFSLVLILWPLILFSPIIGGAAELSPLTTPIAVVMVLSSIVFNAVTFAVLLFVLRTRDPLLSALTAGIRGSRKFAASCAIPLIAQLLIVGSIAVVSVNFETTSRQVKESISETTVDPQETVTTRRSGGQTFTETTRSSGSRKTTNSRTTSFSTTEKSKFRWNVAIYALFEFPVESGWLSTTMTAVESTSPAIIAVRLSMLLMILAIVVKIEIAGRIFGTSAFVSDDFDDRFRPEVLNVLAVAVMIVMLFPFELFGAGRAAQPSHGAALSCASDC